MNLSNPNSASVTGCKVVLPPGGEFPVTQLLPFESHPVFPQTRPEVQPSIVEKLWRCPGLSLKPPPAGIWLSPKVPTHTVSEQRLITLI